MIQGKLLIPLQYFGLGDIIYQQSLVHTFMEQGYKVLWPVDPKFVEGLNRAYPLISFIDHNILNLDYRVKKDSEQNGIRVIPLRWADNILKMRPEECMKAKYKLYNLDWKIWKKKAIWQREKQKEKELFRHLGLGENEEYIFINSTYRTSFKEKAKIKTETGIRTVEMSVLEGYSIFDWAKVIENAKEIHTVVTSLFYLLELLDLKQPIHLYPRENDPTHEHVSYLFTKPYILHY